MDRPAFKQLLADVRAKRVDVVVVYKIDRLTRSLTDFAKIVEVLDDAGISFVSVTQVFNTTNSMGRLTLNVLLSFAQFEREVIAERIRDKVAASKARGMWMGGRCRSATGSKTASSSSCPRKRRACARSWSAMFAASRCASCWSNCSVTPRLQAPYWAQRQHQRRTAVSAWRALRHSRQPHIRWGDQASRQDLPRRARGDR